MNKNGFITLTTSVILTLLLSIVIGCRQKSEQKYRLISNKNGITMIDNIDAERMAIAFSESGALSAFFFRDIERGLRISVHLTPDSLQLFSIEDDTADYRIMTNFPDTDIFLDRIEEIANVIYEKKIYRDGRIENYESTATARGGGVFGP